MSQRPVSAPGFKPKNKIRREEKYREIQKNNDKTKRDRNFARKREEQKNPKLKEQRLAANVPTTIDRKRVFDEVDIEEGDGIGFSVDVESLKKRKIDADEQAKTDAGALTETNLKKVEELEALSDDDEEEGSAEDDDDLGSLMDSGSEAESTAQMPPPALPNPMTKAKPIQKASPPASTTSTSLTHIPDALAARFPSLFHSTGTPKILITTTVDSMLHHEADLLTGLFPNSFYHRRTEHRYRAHRPSIRDICAGARKRGYTAVMILGEDKKKPSSLQIIHLPPLPTDLSVPENTAQGIDTPDTDAPTTEPDPTPPTSTASEPTPQTQPPPLGPTFTFSLKNFIPPKRISGHGNPTPHFPELLLNNFRTPLGLLTGTLFRTLLPPLPELSGRQAITFHNQRDYIFVRRHRYIFRERRASEKKVVDSTGKPVAGAEEIRTGLQELGPRFTLKLRRVDEGVGRISKTVWRWRAGDEKVRTRFAL